MGEVGHICDGLVFAMAFFFAGSLGGFQLDMMTVGYFP